MSREWSGIMLVAIILDVSSPCQETTGSRAARATAAALHSERYERTRRLFVVIIIIAVGILSYLNNIILAMP